MVGRGSNLMWIFMKTLTDAQLRAEIERCEYCEQKPCRDACPAHCSPADFIMAASMGEPSDIARAAAMILSKNPLGGTCGAVCPETHCMSRCSRGGIDQPINIPAVQATIVVKAARLGMMPRFRAAAEPTGKRVAVVGAGPAGLAAAFTLSQLGHGVDLFEQEPRLGGACRQIPDVRLSKALLSNDLEFIRASKLIEMHTGKSIDDPRKLEGFDAVLVAAGLSESLRLGVPGEDAALSGSAYLKDPSLLRIRGPVAVVGGGAVACDCALTARLAGAEHVEMLALEKLGEMPLAEHERRALVEYGIEVSGRTRVLAIDVAQEAVVGVRTLRVAYPKGDLPLEQAPPAPIRFDPRSVVDVEGSEQRRGEFRHVIVAIGNRNPLPSGSGLFYAGDGETGPSTVVEASAAGKNAAAEIHAHLTGAPFEAPARKVKSTLEISGHDPVPVSLQTDFFGRTLRSPFILSAAPPTDGYAQMKAAFEAGWAGGIMKTAFDNVPIHIPAEYMCAFDGHTWGNCDNVSGHPLERVCDEIRQLVAEYPDRLVMASTGGPVSGDDAADAAAWQSNTRKLEAAGAMGIEYSLSCPQGGDGTEGDIVSQSPASTAKIIEWILQTADPTVPKLFKLTAAVTSVAVIVRAVKEVLDRYPQAKAGVTLANTFPTLNFRKGSKPEWEEGVVVGMSGAGVTPISNLTLASVAGLGVSVSGNGGPMDYKAAAHFLALGAETVQFCTIAMKHGYGIIDELVSGLSYLMKARGIPSVKDLIGIALPNAVTDFMDLSAVKKISEVDRDLCVSCGNCARCSYGAIALDKAGLPATDPAVCVGCSICALSCMAGALQMRPRTPEELAVLREDGSDAA